MGLCAFLINLGDRFYAVLGVYFVHITSFSTSILYFLKYHISIFVIRLF